MAKVEFEIVVETSKRRKQLRADARRGVRPARIVKVGNAFHVGIHRNSGKPWKICLMAGPFKTRKQAEAEAMAAFLATVPTRTLDATASETAA